MRRGGRASPRTLIRNARSGLCNIHGPGAAPARRSPTARPLPAVTRRGPRGGGGRGSRVFTRNFGLGEGEVAGRRRGKGNISAPAGRETRAEVAERGLAVFLARAAPGGGAASWVGAAWKLRDGDGDGTKARHGLRAAQRPVRALPLRRAVSPRASAGLRTAEPLGTCGAGGKRG